VSASPFGSGRTDSTEVKSFSAMMPKLPGDQAEAPGSPGNRLAATAPSVT